MNNVLEHCESYLKSTGFRKDPITGIWVNESGETFAVTRNGLVSVSKWYTRAGYLVHVSTGRTTNSLAKVMCRAFTGATPKKIKYKDGNNKNCSLENIIPEGARII